MVTIAATVQGAWVAFLLWYTMIAEGGSPEAMVLGSLSLALAGLVIGVLVMRRSRPPLRSVGLGVLTGSVSVHAPVGARR